MTLPRRTVDITLTLADLLATELGVRPHPLLVERATEAGVEDLRRQYVCQYYDQKRRAVVFEFDLDR